MASEKQGIGLVDPEPWPTPVDGAEVLDATEAELFRETWPPASPERVAFELAIHTGQRAGDLLRLTRADYAAGRITLRQSKTGERVDIPASDALRAILDPWLRSHDALTLLVGRSGRPIQADRFKHMMGRAIAAAGLEGCVFHGLRHTCATLLAEAGCDWPTIAAVTGHRTAEMVRRYTSKRRLADEAVERIDNRGGKPKDG